MTEVRVHDPYRHCETKGCTHDLAKGVLLSELLGGDGPFPPIWDKPIGIGWLAEALAARNDV